jgi:hypothetical protein
MATRDEESQEQKKSREARRRKVIHLDDLLSGDDVKGGAGKPRIVFGQVDKGEPGKKKR